MEYMAPSGRKRDIRYEADGFYIAPNDLFNRPHGAISLVRRRKAVRVDVKHKEVVLDNGERVKFDKCLIATGAF